MMPDCTALPPRVECSFDECIMLGCWCRRMCISLLDKSNDGKSRACVLCVFWFGCWAFFSQKDINRSAFPRSLLSTIICKTAI